MTSTKPTGTNFSSFPYSDEAFLGIFCHIDDARSFKALAQTCTRLCKISLSIPVIAGCSLPKRAHLLQRALRSDPKLQSAALQFTTAKNTKKLGELGNKLKEDFYLALKESCKILNVELNNHE